MTTNDYQKYYRKDYRKDYQKDYRKDYPMTTDDYHIDNNEVWIL